ncbi:hypothetical protein C8J56DRAFT_888711 [Mycena floridula]|nr:hypothetical protein C8J56DRAFT_888711 [Mycena floridula]
MRLPAEILDLILFHAPKDARVLKILALVSPDFLHHARRHLFAKLRLSGKAHRPPGVYIMKFLVSNKHRNRCHQISQTLSLHPDLPSYVRQVSLDAETLHDPTFLAVIASFAALEAIEINQVENWQSTEPVVPEALRMVFGSTRMKEIVFKEGSVELPLLAQLGSSVRSLVLDGTTLRNGPGAQEYEEPLYELDSLFFTSLGCNIMLPVFFQQLSASMMKLRSLTLDVRDDVMPFIQHCSDSLGELSLFGGRFASLTHIDLSKCHNLHTLRLRNSLYLPPFWGPTLNSAPSSLRDINMVLLNAGLVLADAPWSKVEAAIVARPREAGQQVRVSLCTASKKEFKDMEIFGFEIEKYSVPERCRAQECLCKGSAYSVFRLDS